MTQDIASLGIKVETGEVAKASTELDGLAQAGAKAEKATESLSGESKKASISIKAMAAETKAAEAATAKLGKQTAATGVSAAQTAAALRGVPAQVTDIITSLQGGQAPLQVLLQQGGQLKDMFGGVVPAAKALGGYVTGLINPFTLAAAAAAALGLAYYKGSEEATAYNKALILTGNAAGTSADQLASLAKQISSTIGTTGAAAEVLAQLAGSGNVAAYSFEEITKAALTMKDATGKAVEETVAQFASIAKEPVAASIKLNEQYHYLTASVYEQIVALEKQGQQAEAVRLATDAVADAIQGRGDQITQRLGLIEGAWNKVAKAANWAWDAALDVGREATYEEKLAELETAASNAARLGAGPRGTGGQGAAGIEAQRASLMLEEQDRRRRAQANKDDQDAEERSIQARQRLNLLVDKGKSLTEQTAAAYAKIDKDAESAARRGTAYTKEQLAQAKKVEFERINGKPTKSGGAKQLNLTGYNDAQNAIKDLQATYSNSEKELEAQQKAGLITQDTYATQRAVLIKAEKEEVTSAYQAEIKALEAVKAQKGTTAEQSIQLDQKISDAKSAMVRAQKDSDSQLEVLRLKEKERLDKQKLAIQTYTDALNQQNITLRQQGQREAASLGMGDRQKGLQSQFNGIDDKANAQRIDLANQYGDGSRGMSLDEYNAKLKAVAQSQQDLRNTVIANYDDMTSAQGSWTAGASSAWENYLESTRDVAGQTKSLLTNAFTSAEDALVQFVTTGKLSFSDFAKSVLSDMARIAVRQASSSALSGLFGIAASAAGGASSGGSASYTGAYGFDAGGYTGDGGKYQPAGIVHKGEVVIRKEVVQQRGMRGYLERLNKRGYADGGYVGSSDGSASQGGGGETPIVVNVDARESGASGVDPVRLAEAIKVTVRQEIATARRNGGQLA
ncbi:phage tail tape measure protein [Pseudomonas sp. MIL9]|uniref:phage tail tape measure protein n=1 Tax=Pseudomonas sp. MIL9 TaxID=2807620 RepID=UPI001950E1BE|nr:phage tail tape measure protein [Pseudomonas sp. MIL9]MBM6442409.1 phage tail tape measure protein [Pseudomonas sp. MIL9]